MVAQREIYYDLSLERVSQLKNARIHNITTSERSTLASALNQSNNGLLVWDTDLNASFYWNGTAWVIGSSTTVGTGGGTVTSVGLSLPSTLFITTGSPVTNNGVLTGTLTPQAHNTVWAGPMATGASTPTFRELVLKDLPLKLYSESETLAAVPNALGQNSVAIGAEAATSISAPNSLAIGQQSLTRIPGSIAIAYNRFASSGDAQSCKYFLKTHTINNAPTEAFIDGTSGSIRLQLPDNSTWTFTATITAHQTSSGSGHAGFKVDGVVYRDSGASTIAVQGVFNKTVLSRSHPQLDINMGIDIINGSLKLTVSGQPNTTIRWLCVIDTVEITN